MGDSLLHVGICCQPLTSQVPLKWTEKNHWAPQCQQQLWRVTTLRLGCYKPLSVQYISHKVIPAICNRHRYETSRHFLATDTWHQFFLHQDKHHCATVEQMLKCQWWMGGGLMCTICYPYAIDISMSAYSSWHPSVWYFILLSSFVFIPTFLSRIQWNRTRTYKRSAKHCSGTTIIPVYLLHLQWITISLNRPQTKFPTHETYAFSTVIIYNY